MVGGPESYVNGSVEAQSHPRAIKKPRQETLVVLASLHLLQSENLLQAENSRDTQLHEYELSRENICC